MRFCCYWKGRGESFCQNWGPEECELHIWTFKGVRQGPPHFILTFFRFVSGCYTVSQTLAKTLLLLGMPDILPFLYFYLGYLFNLESYFLLSQTDFSAPPCLFFFFFWLHWGFVAVHGLSLVVASGGYSLLWCTGFSLRWPLLLQSTRSRRVGFSSCGAGFSSCGLRTLERRLSSCGARA